MTETAKIVALKPPVYLSEDFGRTLRELADRADRNEIETAMVAILAVDGTFEFYWPSSGRYSLVLASIAQKNALARCVSS